MHRALARRLSRGLAGYVLALAALWAVVGLILAFPHIPRQILSYVALLVLLGSAWWGGYGPGIAVTISAVIVSPFVATKNFSFEKINYTNLVLLLMVSVLVSLVASSRRKVESALRRANETLDERVRQRTAELERANQVLQEREAQLLLQAEQLSTSNAHLEQFAYVASHDLQEPLRMIAVYTELIGRRCAGRLDAETEQFMGTVVSGVRRMEQLIRDLLAYSRSIHMTSEPEPVDSAEALRSAMMNLEATIIETDAQIEFDQLPVVEADRVLLTQVFQNLLSNALKYRGEENPRIGIEAIERDSQWVFSVGDNGIGIHSNYHETVFSPFKRLHSQRYPGTGVGLAICRQIIDRLGGRIWVESEPGSGATFYFSIPVRNGLDLSSRSEAKDLLLMDRQLGS
jgi:signal transduction histidine kinase